MKTFTEILVSIASAVFIIVVSLAISGHLAVVPLHQITNVVDDNGNTLFELSDTITGYRIILTNTRSLK